MVRERLEKGSEPVSRFFTTAMLPKLTLLNKRRRVALLVATNHVEAFDSAILRRGRFDVVVQIMPPTADEKLRKWSKFKDNLAACHIDVNDDIRLDLSHLQNFRSMCPSFPSPVRPKKY
jgi:SpoVK/Ycf46/Vps4 family AAA+-type ATPase